VQSDSVNSVFCLQVQAFLNDVMVLFTDYDATFEEFKDEENDQTIEPEKIDDDEHRNEYLANYQGIIFTTENLSFATTIKVNITTEVKKLMSENSFFKTRFLCLSALNSAKLFEIRNKRLEGLRRLEQANTMDNYHYFCAFFGIDQQTIARYSAPTREFKTMFPVEVLHNESIQHAIMSATGGYESVFDARFNQQTKPRQAFEPNKAASLFGEGNFESVEEDLNFRECDTIAMIELVEYH